MHICGFTSGGHYRRPLDWGRFCDDNCLNENRLVVVCFPFLSDFVCIYACLLGLVFKCSFECVFQLFALLVGRLGIMLL